jgi:hypothetical protein
MANRMKYVMVCAVAFLYIRETDGYSNCAPRALLLTGGFRMSMLAKRTTICLVVLIAFISGTSVSPYIVATPQSTKSQKKQVEPQKPETKPQKREKRTLSRAGKDFKVKKGAEITAKVRKLKDSNKNVRAALKVFEDKKRTPKSMRHSASVARLVHQRRPSTIVGNRFNRMPCLNLNHQLVAIT